MITILLVTIGLFLFFQLSQKYLRKLSLTNSIPTSPHVIYFTRANMALGSYTPPKLLLMNLLIEFLMYWTMGSYLLLFSLICQRLFDTLNHNILLKKLNYYGITGTPLLWFKSYLSNRSQYVSFNGKCSTLLPLTCGVPQGSILGPLLFIIYVNDMHKASSKFDSILYADDTSLVSSLCLFDRDPSSSEGCTSDKMNLELDKVMS